MKSDLVRINKEMNLNKVDIEEGFQNLYVNILQTINTMDKYEHIKLTRADLIKLLGTNSRNAEYLHNIFVRLTGSNEIKIGEKKIYGSIFSAKAEKDGSYLIAVNEFYKEYLFTKADIELMHKAKKYSHLPLTKEEAEYWYKKLKEKKKFLMLLNNKSIKALRGKNNKIIYSMLKEFAGSIVQTGEHRGECFRKISYKEFKEMLQLSETYRNDNIDRLLKKAQKDITELTEITVSEIKTFPEKLGRGAKKEYMIIFFFEKAGTKVKKKLEAEKTEIDAIDELLTISNDGDSKKEKFEEPEEITKLKMLIKKQIKNRKDYFELWGKLIPLETEKEIYDFIAENQLIINFELIETPDEEKTLEK